MILIYFILAYTTVFGITTTKDFFSTVKIAYNLLLGDFDIIEFNDT